MPTTCIPTLDPVSKRPLPIIRDSNVLWSSGKQIWDGLSIERQRYNELDTPEFEIPDYSLIIQLSPRLVIEEKIRGFYQSRLSKPGNIWLYTAGAARQLRAHRRLEVLVLTLSPDLMTRAFPQSPHNFNPELIEHHQLRDAQIRHIALALKAEVENGYLSGRLYGESLGLALSSHLLAEYSAVKTVHWESKGGMTPSNLRRVVGYIHDHLAEDLRLSALAEVAGLSAYRFSHNFKQATGLAPHQYVIHERMELAKRLLRDTEMSVIAIAYAVGCGSPSRFTLLFHRATGVTPSAYRASF